MFDGEAFGQQMVEIVRGYVQDQLEPILAENKALTARIAALEARKLPDVPELVEEAVTAAFATLPVPKDGKSVTIDDVRPLVEEAVTLAVAALPVPKDGESVTIDDVQPLVAEAVTAAVAALPVPKDGESVTIADVQPLIDEAVTAAVAALPVPKDGESVTIDDVQPLIDEAVTLAVAALPVAKDGESVTLDDVRPIIEAAVAALPVPKDGESVDPQEVERMIADGLAKAVAALPPPAKGEPGVGVAGAVIDRDGMLILTLSNGTMANLGKVVGEKGRDGLGLEDLDTYYDGERALKLTFSRDDYEYSHSMKLAIPIYRGVYSDARSYEKGDMVTWAGSVWHAEKDEPGKPDTADSGWTLAVKRGRDGKGA